MASMSSALPAFRFEEFAADIYRELPNAHRQPFLLPALYGGSLDQRREPVQKYEILFGFSTPSVAFTERRWPTQCDNSKDAVEFHRRIFFKWAYAGVQAYLFRSLYENQDFEIFWQRFYVTNLWKDTENRLTYWKSKLKIELENVSARLIVFAGEDAATEGRGLMRWINSRVPTSKIRCPTDRWMSNDPKGAGEKGTVRNKN